MNTPKTLPELEAAFLGADNARIGWVGRLNGLHREAYEGAEEEDAEYAATKVTAELCAEATAQAAEELAEADRECAKALQGGLGALRMLVESRTAARARKRMRVSR